MPLKANEFVELDYTGFIKENNVVFDTTSSELAKKSNLVGKPGAVIVCLGRGHLLKGLEAAIIGKELGKHRIELSADNAFGKKNPKFINLIPTSNFINNQVRPQPGLPVEVDGKMGIVKAVAGGRTIVDFNHPVSGKDVVYDVTIHKIVTDTQAQAASIVKLWLGAQASVTVTKDEAAIAFKVEIPKQLQEFITKELTETTAIKHVKFGKA